MQELLAHSAPARQVLKQLEELSSTPHPKMVRLEQELAAFFNQPTGASGAAPLPSHASSTSSSSTLQPQNADVRPRGVCPAASEACSGVAA